MIKTIIFDIGNVLVDFCWEPFFRSFGFREEILSRIARATVQSPDWVECDRGVLTEKELVKRFIENDPALEKEIKEVMKNTKGIIRLREYTIPWIREMKKKGYQILVLSNFSEKAEKECAEDMVFMKEIDGGILSYQEKMVKPMPAIYWTLLEKYGLNPEECVFIDDMPENVAAAEKAGIRGILFKDWMQAKESLLQLGIN